MAEYYAITRQYWFTGNGTENPELFFFFPIIYSFSFVDACDALKKNVNVTLGLHNCLFVCYFDL